MTNQIYYPSPSKPTDSVKEHNDTKYDVEKEHVSNRLDFSQLSETGISIGFGSDLTPFKLTHTKVDNKNRLNRNMLGVGSSLERVIGIVIELEKDNALVEFEKAGQRFERIISLSKLRNTTTQSIRPGDGIAIVSSKLGNGFYSEFMYLGKATVRMDEKTLDKLDERFRAARKRKD